MLKNVANTKKMGGGYSAFSISLGKRLWLSLILSLICATLLCCAFLLPKSNVASASVSSDDVIKWESVNNHQYYEVNFTVNDNKGRPLTLALMPDGPDASHGVCSFDEDTATAYGSNIVNSMKVYVANYVHFKATVKIPAFTEYTITFSETMYINAKVSSSSGTWRGWADFYAYGETDKSGEVQFGYLNNTSGTQVDYTTPSGVTRIHNSVAPTTSGSKKTFAPAEAYTGTFTNNTNAEVEKTLYFGFFSTILPSRGYVYTYDSSATVTADITVTSINVPSADKASAIYDADGNTFTFTDYDKDRLDYTLSYENASGKVSDITGAVTINTDGTCKLTGAGTYTFTFKIKDNCGAVWDSATNDRTAKTVTVKVTQKTVSAPGGTVTTEYNGEEQSLSTLSAPPGWYDAALYENTSIISMDDDFTDAIEKEVAVTLVSDNYVWSDYNGNPAKTRTFTFKINKKELAVTFEDVGGLFVAKYDEAQLYNRDKADGKKPELITKYSKTGTLDNAVDSPTGLGLWYAIAVLKNDCNWYVDGMKDFTASKKSVAYPVLSPGSSANEQYNGDRHTFTFDGYDGDLMTFTVPDGTTFDGTELTVVNAGEYTIVYTLKDTDLYQWSGDTALKVTVEKKNVLITSDEGNPAEWVKGESAVELKFRVTGLVSGESVKLEASYTKGGAGSAKIAVADNGDGTYTVTIPKTYGTGDYVLSVTVAEGENYSERAAATHSFRITAEGLDLGENEIKWQIDGTNYTVDDYKEGFIEIEYTGKPLKLSVDISASDSAAELTVDGYGGDYATATAVGEYTATVHIVAADPNLYVFDETFTLKIKIVPKTIALKDAEWEWQYAGDGEWQALSDGNMPQFDDRAVSVRISPEFFAKAGLAEGDYSVVYHHNNNLTEKGDKTTSAQVTVTNPNFRIENDTVTKDWKITAKALKHTWTGTQTLTAGENTFEFPAIEFEDGGDYSGFFEYYFTVDGDDTEYTKAELEAYIAEHWTETTAVAGKVHVRPIEGQEVVIASDSHIFTTGTPKTALEVTISAEDAQYGAVNFGFTVKRGGADERGRTVVTVSGGKLDGDKTFDGDSAGLEEFINGLDAGEYRIKVSVTAENSGAYVVTGDYSYRLNIAKRKLELPALKGGVTYNGDVIYFKDCIEGFDGGIMTILGADDNAIDSGTEWRENGYFTTVRLNDPDNYEFIVDGEGVSEYEYNWHIGKFIITEDMWDKSGQNGAFLNLPDWVKAMLTDPETLKLDYSYFNDLYSGALENTEFVKGNSYYVNASLSGGAAGNFGFENGTEIDGVQISAKTLYTVPKGSSGGFIDDVGEFVKNNYWVLIVIGIGLLFLILLIVLLSRRRSRADDYYDDDYDYDEDDEDDEDDYDDDY